jgi:hypothetical protein
VDEFDPVKELEKKKPPKMPGVKKPKVSKPKVKKIKMPKAKTPKAKKPRTPSMANFVKQRNSQLYDY